MTSGSAVLMLSMVDRRSSTRDAQISEQGAGHIGESECERDVS